jgi:hypothetical protein
MRHPQSKFVADVAYAILVVGIVAAGLAAAASAIDVHLTEIAALLALA